LQGVEFEGETVGYRRFAEALSQRSSLVPAALYFKNRVSLDECRAICKQRVFIGALHCLWLRASTSASSTDGDCGVFMATRTPEQATLWRGYFEWVAFLFDLSHVDRLDDRRVPIRVTAALEVPTIPRNALDASLTTCGSSDDTTTQACMWCAPRAPTERPREPRAPARPSVCHCFGRWTEFTGNARSEFVDSGVCYPSESAAVGVLTPAQILRHIQDAHVAYPPPPPPPPRTESPPPPPQPPPEDFKCYFQGVPQTTNTDPHIPCPLWNAGQGWPQHVVHQDLYEANPACAERDRRVQYERGFFQPRDLQLNRPENRFYYYDGTGAGRVRKESPNFYGFLWGDAVRDPVASTRRYELWEVGDQLSPTQSEVQALLSNHDLVGDAYFVSHNDYGT
jgi:hypothetical protein